MDPVTFNPDDASQLIDLLNEKTDGHKKPDPVKQLLCVLVRTTSTVSPATCATPGTGNGRMLGTQFLTEVSAPFLERLIWIDTPVIIPLKSWRSQAIPSGTIIVARREELRNEWTV